MKTQRKHGFTIVELVIVIAIIAILAAILIPTFVSIIKKANNSAYLQERTSQQIADLAEKVENQNYLTWEDFEAKLAIAMANSENNTSAKITEAVKNALSGISGAGLSEEQVKKIVEKALDGQLTVTQVEAIVSKAISGIPSSAGITEAQIRTIVNNVIGSIPQTGVTKAQVDAAIKSAISGLAYDIQNEITNAVNDALEKFKSDALTSEDVQKIIEAVINGQSSKITLTLNKDNLSLNVGASETLVATVTPEGTEIGWVSSDTSVATVSNGTVTAVAAGNATITVTAGGATVTCAVTVTEVTIKNGLVNGCYYKDDELFTGNENGYDFIDGNLVIKLDSKTYTGSGVVDSRTYNYVIESSDYLTQKVIIDGGNSSYCNLATINITDNSGKNYTVKSVQGKAPFDGLLSKNGWTTEDVNTYLMNAGGKDLVTGGYNLTNANILTGYSTSADDPDNYDMFIPKLCIDSPIVSNYFTLTGCANVADYYSKWQNNSLVITLADYLKLAYGNGYTLTRDGDQIKYSKSFGDAFESEWNGNWQSIIEPDSSTGLPLMKLNNTNGVYMTAPTKVVEGKLYFEDYVIDADDSTHIASGDYLRFINLMFGSYYYITIYDNNTKVKVVKNSTEYIRFEIDQTNNVIRTYISNQNLCVNGIPYSIPSSGSITLVDGKVSLTGAFDVSNVNIPASAIGNLVGTQNSPYLMFEPALIEYAIKVVYQGLQVQCNASTVYNLNNISATVFSKTENTLSCTFECGPYSSYNILNGVDIAGASYVIMLEAN